MAHFRKAPNDGMNAAQRAVTGVLQLVGFLGIFVTLGLIIAIISGQSSLSIWFAIGVGVLSLVLLLGRWGYPPEVLDDEAR